MNEYLNWLENNTTIVRIWDNTSRSIIFGDAQYTDRFNKAHLLCFQGESHKQVTLSDLEGHWNSKWQSFNNQWNSQHQNFRFLYDSFKLFYHSFEQLDINKKYSISNHNQQDMVLHFNELAGASLYGMYHHGKKCIDLLKELSLIKKQEQEQDWDFCEEFSETRNKFIEHNYNPNPKELENIRIEPSIWSLINTNSLMEVYIHNIGSDKEKGKERAYDADVDYYQDYYDLEKIMTKIIKHF